jgi:hypothetical protein
VGVGDIAVTMVRLVFYTMPTAVFGWVTAAMSSVVANKVTLWQSRNLCFKTS